MPKYLRRVEIEDLNRNFWVISQGLTTICAYVFDFNSPLYDLLEGILKELVGLWENTFYLWANLALYSAKDYNEVKVLFLPINNYSEMPYIKFDNFNLGSQQIKERINYIKDSYPNSHLLVIPEIRQDNYFENYYYSVYYPGMWFYDRYQDKWIEYKFIGNNSLNLKQLKEYLPGGIIETENSYSYYTHDMPQLVDYLLRTEIKKGNVSYSNGLAYNNLSIRLTDVSQLLCGGTSYNDCIIGAPNSNNECELNLVLPNKTIDNTTVDINKGYYKGELLSYFVENKPGPEPPAPSIWDESKIGVAEVNPDNEIIGDIEYFMTHDEVVSYLERYEYGRGFIVHVGILMNPIPDLNVGQYYMNYRIRVVELHNQTYIPNFCFAENTDWGGTILAKVSGWQDTVINIGDLAFSGQMEFNEDMANLILPNVQTIGDYAFSDCGGIETVVLNNSIQSIGDCAFQDCSNLKNFTIPTSITVIPTSLLEGTSISSIVIPSNITEIQWRAFAWCNNLADVTLNNGLQTIGYGAFDQDVALTQITIPSTVNSIDIEAFSDCENLTSITVNKPQNSIAGAPWGATNATVVWTG